MEATRAEAEGIENLEEESARRCLVFYANDLWAGKFNNLLCGPKKHLKENGYIEKAHGYKMGNGLKLSDKGKNLLAELLWKLR